MNNIVTFVDQESKAIYTETHEGKYDILKGHFLHYLEECFEAFVAVIIYTLLSNNTKFEITRAIKVSLVVGLITFLLENGEFASHVGWTVEEIDGDLKYTLLDLNTCFSKEKL